MATVFIDDVLKKADRKTFNDLFYDVLDSFDSELSDLEDDIKSGNYSNSEIADRIKEIRDKIY